MKKAASCRLSDRTTVEYAYKFIERSGGLSHKHSQEYWCFSTKAELCGSVEGGERFLQGIKDALEERGQVSVRLLPRLRTWNEQLAAKLIANAKQGDAGADQVLREVAAEFLTKRIPLPDELADYVAAYLQQANSSKKQSHKTEYRDWMLALTVADVARHFNLKPTLNKATVEKYPKKHCACSIVKLATGLHDNTVQTAWHDYQGVADQRTNYVGQAVVSVTYDGAQRHLLERFPRVVSDDGTQEHFLVSFPRVGSAEAMSRPSSRKAQRAKRTKSQRAKRVRN
jgi:hypothetical protein